MELTVYRQSSKIRPDGTIVYKGEDALPYADGQLLIVADGLGGAAAIRHTSIDSRLFDEETLPDTLFSGVFEDYSDPGFLGYVKKSFFELYAVKDCYTDNVNNIKKSGYFASRIVSAIVLHEFTYNKKLAAGSFFGALGRERDAAKKAKAVADVGEYFTRTIAEKLRACANNANIIYESSYSGLSLLGTTLTAALYQETGSETEVLLLTAGDSRPYVWDEKDGLRQLIRDEERPDGGMTNYIQLSDESRFTINSRYMKFRNPCVLFCASDGCFDSGSFLSPLAFEKLLLDTAAASDSPEAMSATLHDFFVDHGRHDDSSTIAMKLCGYANFDELRRAASRRLKAIENDYISQMPKLLENDFIGDFERSKTNAPDEAALLRDELKCSPAVRAFCEEAVKPEAEKSASGDERIAKAAELRSSARADLTELASGLSSKETEISSGSLDKLEAALGSVRSSDSEYDELRRSIFAEALKNAADKYWSSNADTIINEIKSGAGSYPAEMVSEVKTAAESISSAIKNLGSNAELQQALFDKYSEKYSALMRGED